MCLLQYKWKKDQLFINSRSIKCDSPIGIHHRKSSKASSKSDPYKITTYVHEFIFTSIHVTVRKVGMIGADFKPEYQHVIINESQLQGGKPTKITLNPLPGTVEHMEHTASQTVFACPKKECHVGFQSLDELTLSFR